VLRKLTHRKHAVKRMSRFGPETGFEEIGLLVAITIITFPRTGLLDRYLFPVRRAQTQSAKLSGMATSPVPQPSGRWG
jgi:hypothetical protein